MKKKKCKVCGKLFKIREVRNEYLILDSDNHWLDTEHSKRDAMARFKEIKEDMQVGDMEVGETLYLYKAIQLKEDLTE